MLCARFGYSLENLCVNRDTRLTDWPYLNIGPLARAALNVTAFIIAFAMLDVTIQNREHMHLVYRVRALDFYYP